MTKATKYKDKGTEIGKLVEDKNVIYGDSFAKSGDILRILYPNGITVDQYNDILALIRIIDKMFRIATTQSDIEDPWVDIAGYAILKSVQTTGKEIKE